MEGLGIFIVIAYAIYWVNRRLRINSIDRDLRNLAKKKGQDYWTDLGGDMITMDTGEPFDYRKLNPDGSVSTRIWTGSGDMVKINTLTGRIMENVSETERKEAERKGREWAIKTGNRLYPISTERDEKDCYQNRARFDKDFDGRRYRDIKTNNEYVLRWWRFRVAVINVNTGNMDGIILDSDVTSLFTGWEYDKDFRSHANFIELTPENCELVIDAENKRREEYRSQKKNSYYAELYYDNGDVFDRWHDENFYERGHRLVYLRG